MSIATNQWNHDDTINYSHAKARRLPAEVLYDAIHLVTGAQSQFPGVPTGTRAAALPDVGVKLPDGFLGNLGRPARESACECERSNDLQLGPVMALVSGPTVGQALASGENSLSDLVASIDDDHKLFNELFMRILNRPASEEEIDASIETMDIMEEEHAMMSKRLAKMERAWKPREAELESKRWSNIAKAEMKLTNYVEKTREAKDKAKRERDERIATAETALAKYEAELPMHLDAWEGSDNLATNWQPLSFNEMKASFGATLEQLGDASVFASGKNGRGNYDLDADYAGNTITGIRIEALTDERLPKNGPGRADDGNFVVSEFKLRWANPGSNKEVEIAKWEFKENASEWTGNDQVALENKNGALTLSSKGKDPTLTRKLEAKGKLFLLEGSSQSEGHGRVATILEHQVERQLRRSPIGEANAVRQRPVAGLSLLLPGRRRSDWLAV